MYKTLLIFLSYILKMYKGTIYKQRRNFLFNTSISNYTCIVICVENVLRKSMFYIQKRKRMIMDKYMQI